MKNFFSFIIRQFVAIALITAFVLGFGVWSAVNMDVNLLPDINVPMVCVQVIYPGANAASVESDVTEKLEEGLSSVSGITDVQSYSYDNLSALVMSFGYGTDTTQKKNEIQGKLDGLDLPDGVTESVYDIDLNAEALAVLSITSENGADDAYEKAKQLSLKLSALDGVENVETKGGAEYSYTVKPFGGLELICPLIVQAFSYGALDLPLGNIAADGGDVQIRNNSDVKSVDDVLGMPLALPQRLVTLLSSLKQVMRYYSDSTAEDLTALSDDLENGVADVLGRLGGMTADEVDKFAELKTYMNIADYPSSELSRITALPFYNSVKEAVEGLDEEELQELADELNGRYSAVLPFEITVDFLKVVQEDRLEDIIEFRRARIEDVEVNPGYDPDAYYALTDEDYTELARYMGVYGDEYTDAEIAENVDFAKKTSAAGLSNIADKKREEGDGYNPTDGECALLFTATELSAEHPVIMSPTFMAFVRSDAYEENMRILTERRGELGEEITPAEYCALYRELDLKGVFELGVSEELFAFILDTDLTDLSPTADGGSALIVKAGDIASVEKTASYNSYAYYFGGVKIASGITVEVYKSNGANSAAVVEAVKAAYGELASAQGFSAEIHLLDDQSEFISDSVSNVLISMLIGGALAIIIIYVFLKKVRTSLVIAITMPLSVLAALICLSLMGITLNMVSLGGLAVGIGMLVDNSIVVIEAISKHRDAGKTAYEAAVDGTTEVGGALFGSTLTTVCVFIPILFSGGLTAEIFTDLSFAVIFSLTFSLIVAVTVIPSLYTVFEGGKRLLRGGKVSTVPLEAQQLTIDMFSADEEYSQHSAVAVAAERVEKALPKRDKKNFFKDAVIMDKLTAVYSKILPAVLNKKLVTILTALAVFGASVGLLFLTGTEFLPSIDKGQIEVTVSNPDGRRLEDVQSDVLGFSQTITENVENIDYVSVSVGRNGMLALTDTGIITVQLTTNRHTDRTVGEIRGLAEREGLKGVTVKQIDGVVASLMSGADDMSVTVVGSDGETLKEIADKIGEKLEAQGFKDYKNSSTNKSTQYTLSFDRARLAELGLDYQTLVMTLRIGLASYTACTATIDGEEYNIDVRFDGSAVTDRESLENFTAGFDRDGGQIKLKDVLKGGKVTEELTDACLRRSNGEGMISVSATLPGVDAGTAGRLMQSAAAEVLKDYEGYSFESSGITSYLNDAFAGLAVALIISFFLLYAVMAVQFGSAVKPLIVMASIPFSFTGGFIALVITGTSLNVVSFIGLIMLMGVVVNNAIVMLEKIKQLKDGGAEHLTAVKEACAVRLRPILMTTLTTVLALIPLAIGVGQGSELMQPLGIVVIGGLLIGTLVTLVLVPAVYCAVHGLSAKYPDGRKKMKTE